MSPLKNRIWIFTALSVLISQTLILLYWQDAKYITIVNVIISIVVCLYAVKNKLSRRIQNEIETIKSIAGSSTILVTDAMITDLPENVQRWLVKSNIIGKKTNNIVHVIQKGTMRTTLGGKWMRFKAEQCFTINPPAFIWLASIEAAPFIVLTARDKYDNGRGNMLIKLSSIYSIANSSGKEIDQGTLLRYLAEMAWFPQAAVSPYLTWEKIDDLHARVTMDYKNVKADGIYTFNKQGDVTAFSANRYREFNGTYTKEIWSITVTGYKQFNDIKIGNVNEVTWKLKEGDFTWLKVEITEMN